MLEISEYYCSGSSLCDTIPTISMKPNFEKDK